MQEANTVPTFESMRAATAAATAPEATVVPVMPAPELVAPAPVEAAAPEADASETQVATIANGKNVILPQSAFGKLKEEQRQRGKREAMTELEAKFKAAGFSSLDDAIAAMAAVKANTAKTEAKSAPANKPAPAAKPVAKAVETEVVADEEVQETAQPQTPATADKQMQRILREREKLAKQFAAEQAQRRKLQRQLEAKEAEFALRETAVGKGVKDVDYAVRLVQRELTGKTQEQLKTFDEVKFFDNLRQTHPYLFGEMVVPATTGTGVGAAPAAPKAGNVQVAQGAAGKFDARTASTEDYYRALRARGLTPPI